MGEHCVDHEGNMKCMNEVAKNMALLQKDIEYLRRDQETILARFGKHVEEADEDGGWHDRIDRVEIEIKQIKMERTNIVDQMKSDRRNDLIMMRWFMIGSGLLGGGVVSGSIRIWGVLSKIIGA